MCGFYAKAPQIQQQKSAYTIEHWLNETAAYVMINEQKSKTKQGLFLVKSAFTPKIRLNGTNRPCTKVFVISGFYFTMYRGLSFPFPSGRRRCTG